MSAHSPLLTGVKAQLHFTQCCCCWCCVGVALQDAKTMIETNFLSVVVLTREVVKGMMARNRGHIVSGAAAAAAAAAEPAAAAAAI
jgi:NAD(P)-dependent dehydrogenase (short-subunit alcohol dehydrogenase family)